MSVHDVLVKARNLIAIKGWGQGADAGLSGHSYCAERAIAMAGRGTPEAHFLSPPQDDAGDARNALWDVLNGHVHPAPWRWNDEEGRTKEEVLALFDEAIRQTAPAPDLTFLNDRIAEREQNSAFFTRVFS